MYLFELQNVFVEITQYVCQNHIVTALTWVTWNWVGGRGAVVASEETIAVWTSLDIVGLCRKSKAAAQHQLPHWGVAKISQAGLAADDTGVLLLYLFPYILLYRTNLLSLSSDVVSLLSPCIAWF